MSVRRRSAPTARASSPRAWTRRRRSGTPRRRRGLASQGAHHDVVSASFSPDGSRLVTASWDKTVKVWDARTGAEILTLKGHTGDGSFGVVQPRRVADRHRELTTRRRRSGTPRRGAELLTLKGHTASVHSASFSPDGSRLVTGSRDEHGEGLGRRDGAEVLTLKGHTGRSPTASFSPDGSRIVTGERGQDGEGLGRRDGRRDPHAQGAHRLCPFGVVQPRRQAHRHRELGQDGEGLGRHDGPELLTLKGHTDAVSRVVQPRRLAHRHRERRQDGEGLGRQDRRRNPHAQGAHRSRLDRVSFSPDGKRIVTASDDDTAKVWDARTGAEVLTLKGHTGQVSSASFSPDGTRIVTASHDETAKVWDARTGAELLTLKGHTDWRRSRVVQPRRVADRHRELRPDGEGVGRQDRHRDAHAQGAHQSVSRRRSAPTGRGSSPRATTARQESGTTRRSNASRPWRLHHGGRERVMNSSRNGGRPCEASGG